LAERRRKGPYRTGTTVALTLVLLPLLAIPIYLVGTGIADALDDDPTNGVFALGLILGVGLPAMTSLVFARSWSELKVAADNRLGRGQRPRFTRRSARHVRRLLQRDDLRHLT